jgi:hypothetical protein
MSFMRIHCDTAYEGGWLPIVDCACRAYRDSEMLVFFGRRISFGEAIPGCTDCSRPRTSLAEPFFSLSLGSGAECFRHMQSCVKLAQQQIDEEALDIHLYCIPSSTRRMKRYAVTPEVRRMPWFQDARPGFRLAPRTLGQRLHSNNNSRSLNRHRHNYTYSLYQISRREVLSFLMYIC